MAVRAACSGTIINDNTYIIQLMHMKHNNIMATLDSSDAPRSGEVT